MLSSVFPEAQLQEPRSARTTAAAAAFFSAVAQSIAAPQRAALSDQIHKDKEPLSTSQEASTIAVGAWDENICWIVRRKHANFGSFNQDRKIETSTPT